MKKLLCAGAFVLAILAALTNARSASATEYVTGQPQVSIDIAHIRNVLQLTPDQEAYWPPVETALRDIARRQARATDQTGVVRRISNRVTSFVLTSAAVERLVVAARPLIAVLRDDQKRAAGGLAQEMGLGPVLAALN